MRTTSAFIGKGAEENKETENDMGTWECGVRVIDVGGVSVEGDRGGGWLSAGAGLGESHDVTLSGTHCVCM